MNYAEIAQLEFTSTTVWNRVEGSPRAPDADSALQARIRDWAWMIGRQWALGELQGNDAASPIDAHLEIEHLPITGLESGLVEGLLEAALEGGDFEPDLRARTQAGLELRRLLAPEIYDGILRAFPLPSPEQFDAMGLRTDPGSEAFYHAVSSRVADGYEASLASDDALAQLGLVPAQLRVALDQVTSFLSSTYTGLESPQHWQRESLEYASEVDLADNSNVLRVDEHKGGRLDWWGFDVSSVVDWKTASDSGSGSFMPTPVEFAGMPLSRYWQLEDYQVDFGQLSAAKTDLARLLVAEFALVYSEDWFSVPLVAPRGSLVRVAGLTVTDVFGERFDIPQAGVSSALEWDTWTTGHPTVSPLELALDQGPMLLAADQTLVFAPTAMAASGGPTIEETLIARDEMANKVWGVEVFVSNTLGEPTSMSDFWDQREEPRATPVVPGLSYELMSRVPYNWIPFVPVVSEDSDLPRSRSLEQVPFIREVGGEPVPIRPSGRLLMAPLDAPYRLNEENVNRVAQRVVRRFERARGPDGAVQLWVARSRGAAEPQAPSGLTFDSLTDSPTSEDG